MKNHTYILSGLGADERVFSRINFPENHTHLGWIANTANESLTSYAARMTEKINHPNPILVGLSFGGIVAQEIAAILPVKELILISTIKSKNEKPWYFEYAARFNLIGLMPAFLLAKPTVFVRYAFSLNTKEDETVLKSCFGTATPRHVKWAMTQIANWKGVKTQTSTYHIHSQEDRIFTKSRSQADAFIQGGHFAVYTHAEELNDVLHKKFTEL